MLPTTVLMGTALLCITGALLVTFHTRKSLEGTTLPTAWAWMMAAGAGWWISVTVSLLLDEAYASRLDQFWYWTAVLTVCPPIAVLGARRPTSRVWNWFILAPLVAVLGWPAVTVLVTFPDLAPLQVQTPVFVGFALVLVMGLGNYAGTRYGLAALLAALASGLVLLPASSRADLSFDLAMRSRGWGAILLSLAIYWAFRQGRRPTVAASRFDRLWFDIRDTFGIVWSIRLQERINATAEQEGWTSRLGPDGFAWKEDVSPEERSRTEERMEHTLRWLLRRFADPEWIDRRLELS
jgi:hypothetical protein